MTYPLPVEWSVFIALMANPTVISSVVEKSGSGLLGAAQSDTLTVISTVAEKSRSDTS